MTIRHYSGFVSVDWEVDGEDVGPLLWCLSFAISNAFPFDYFLRGILTEDQMAPGGGDPGWVMYPERLSDGTIVYHASTDPGLSYMEPCDGVYDESTVKRLVRRTLENYRKAHPEQFADIDAAVAKYDL